MPTCKSSRRKVKQLRALPAKLAELPDDTRNMIMAELRKFIQLHSIYFTTCIIVYQKVVVKE